MKRFVSVFPPAFNDTYVKATTGSDKAHTSINPSNSLTGDSLDTQWWGSGYLKRFSIDLGSPVIIKYIYYENFHISGNSTAAGAKNFTFWGSNSATAFAQLSYSVDTDWTQLTTDISQMVKHVEIFDEGAGEYLSDISDPHFIAVTNSTAYQYYCFKIANTWGNSGTGIRRIELQKEVEVAGISNISSIQNISQIIL